MSTDTARRRLRLNAAEALAGSATRTDLVADLLAVTRGVGQPGAREVADAVEIAQLWADIEGDFATPPDLDTQGTAATG